MRPLTPTSSPAVQPLTVAQVVSALGPHVVTATSGDLGASVTEVLVTDPQHPQPLRPGALVLAVGIAPGSPAWDDVTAAPGLAGVLVKATAPVEATTAVLCVATDADWGEVAAVVRAGLAGPLGGEGATLSDLVDLTSALCGGPVVLLDADFALLAHAGHQPDEATRHETILQRRTPAAQVTAMRELGVVARLQAGDVVHVPDGQVPGLGERWAAGVVVGGVCLGTLWVVPGPDAGDLEPALRRAVAVAQLPLLKAVAAARARDDERDAALEALLTGGPTARAVAERLGVPVDAGFVLAGLRPLALERVERMAASRRLRGHARAYLEAYRTTAAVAAVGDALYVLFPCVPPAGRTEAVRLVTDLHRRLQGLVAHRAVISSDLPHLTEAATARSVVDDLLDLAERRGWSSLTDSDDVQATWRLQQFREIALAHPALLQGPVMRVVDYDREHGGDLLETLRRWFAAVGDARATADALGLHVNTVRYRLKRIEEISGLQLDDPDARLLAELQVRLLLGD